MSSLPSTGSDDDGPAPLHSNDCFHNDLNLNVTAATVNTGRMVRTTTMTDPSLSSSNVNLSTDNLNNILLGQTNKLHHRDDKNHKPASSTTSTTVPIMVEKKRDREKKRRTDITNAIDELVKLLVKIDPSLIMVRNNQVFGILSSTGSLLPLNDPNMYHLQASSVSTHSAAPSGGIGGPSTDLENHTVSTSTQQLPPPTESYIGMKRRYRTSLIGDPVPLNRTDIIHHAARVIEKIHTDNEEQRKEIQHLKLLIAQHQSTMSNYNPVVVPTWNFPFYTGSDPNSTGETTAPSNLQEQHHHHQLQQQQQQQQQQTGTSILPSSFSSNHYLPLDFPSSSMLSSLDDPIHHFNHNTSQTSNNSNNNNNSMQYVPTIPTPSLGSITQPQSTNNTLLSSSNMINSNSSNISPSSSHVFDLHQQLLLAQQQYQLQAMYQQQVLLYQQQQNNNNNTTTSCENNNNNDSTQP